MATVEEIQRQILALEPDQAAALADWVLAAVPRSRVVGPGIEVDPRVCGGDPRIAGTRIPVWVLDSYRQLGATEEELLRNYPSLNSDDLANAWSYAAAHREEVDQLIAENDQA